MSPIVFRPLPEDDPQTRQPDITLARTQLGWEPKVSLEEGIERTIGFFQQALAAAPAAPPAPGAPGDPGDQRERLQPADPGEAARSDAPVA